VSAAGSLIFPVNGDPPCTVDTNCPTGAICFSTTGTCFWHVSETAPVCVRDVAGQGARPAGAACSLNSDCAGGFCEASLGVCVDVCCSDAACPTGLTCESQVVEAADYFVTEARVCVNLSTAQVLMRK